MRAPPQAGPAPAPAWAVGHAVSLVEVPAAYREALSSIAWTEGDEPDVAVMVPGWALRVCSLSRRGRSLLLRVWLEWCAAGGHDAERRALLMYSIARLMRPDEARRAIQQMVHGGT